MSRDYIPRPERGVELKSRPLPGVNYQDPPATERRSDAATEGDLEATRIPFGPHKGKTLLQLLNDHPGYLLHLSEEAFTDHEEFELAVEDFCAKYQHRLDRATGGSQASTLWAVSLSAMLRTPHANGVVETSAHDAAVIEAIDHRSAEALALEKALHRFPDMQGFSNHCVAIQNIPIAQLRRALKTESPGGAR